jgi:large subunit ribosomal protein L18
VFRSRRNFSAQAIDDGCGATLASISTESPHVKEGLKIEGNVLVENAKALGVQFAKILQGKGISMIVFDRIGYAFHGLVRAFAEGAREGGVLF